MQMSRWIQISLFLLAYGFSSPFYSLETLPGDIMYAKERGSSFYEVQVISVDSLRSTKRFWNGKPYSGETMDSTPGSHSIYRTSFLCRFGVLSELAGKSHPMGIPLIAVDSRVSAETVWKEIWTEDNRQGKTFILILEKNGQIRALFQAVSKIPKDDEMGKRWRKSVNGEIVELLKGKERKDYINSKSLIRLFKREGFDLN